MARTVRDTQLETRTARLRLASRGKPYWRMLQSGLHLGYRRLRTGGGTWAGRRFCGKGRYVERQLGFADDFQEPDGTTVLSFREAQDATRLWWTAEQRRALGLEEQPRGAYSVAMALEDYVKDYVWRGGKDLTNVQSIIHAHVLPAARLD
jgi:hypothetical protein